jgi:hypothetical protein
MPVSPRRSDLKLAGIDGVQQSRRHRVRPRAGRIVVLEAHILLVQLGQRSAIVRVDPEPAKPVDPAKPAAIRATKESSRLRTTPGVTWPSRGQQPGGRVDLGEPVELVAGDVEQQGVGRRDDLGELQRVRLVEFEDRDVGGEPAGQRRPPRASRRSPRG